MTYKITCTYCGHIQIAHGRAIASVSGCEKCHDPKLIVREFDPSTVDYYAGSPPFLPKAEKPKENIEEAKKVEEEKPQSAEDKFAEFYNFWGADWYAD